MFEKYDAYKDSGVEWIGQIPINWSNDRLGAILEPISKKGNADKQLLSITREKGVILRDVENDSENHNFIPDDLSNYKLIEKGQFGMNKMKAWQGSYGVSAYTGIVSPAYYVFRFIKPIYPEFFHWAIRSKTYISFFGSASDGVRIGQWDLSKDRMKNIPFVFPNIESQKKIVEFIVGKVEQIDQAITLKEQQISLLNERKQIVIKKAVTQGLNPNVEMTDSGVEWVAQIPKKWKFRKLKFVLSEVNIRSETGNETLLSLSKYKGVIPKDSLAERAGGAASLVGYKKVFQNNLVINKMQAVNGLIAVSEIEGITSPDYSVYTTKDNLINIHYIAFLLNQPEYLTEMKKRVTGVMDGFIRLYTDDLFDIKVLIPSYEDQLQIVQYIYSEIKKIEDATSNWVQQIAKLKEYKTTLINDAVTGKIKVA